ncbi:hypothetical protein JTB14_018515 [Gonioctena quinquepunctata]|nr:hypothetical protein JTB14_018515 [Gonioctena quinquepunctata]
MFQITILLKSEGIFDLVDERRPRPLEENDRKGHVFKKQQFTVVVNRPLEKKEIGGIEREGSINGEEGQHDYIIKKFNLEACKEVSTPGPTVNLENQDGEIVEVPYREAIGNLLFLAPVTRPDITFATNQLSRHMENPKLIHWEGVERIFRHLQETNHFGLFFTEVLEAEILATYSDVDFAKDPKTRKSTSGFVMTFGNCNTAIDWFSRRQPVMALSTAEAK